MVQSNMEVTAPLPSGQTLLPQSAKETGLIAPSQADSTRDRTQGGTDCAFFTVETLAAFLDVPRRTVEKWAMARRLPGMVKVGRLLRFDRTAIQRAALSGSLLLPAVTRRAGNR